MNELKKEFETMVEMHISRAGAYELLAYLEKETDFFESPASTRYHGCYQQGLVEHSLNVFYEMQNEVLRLYDEKQNFSTIDVDMREAVAICALFHDICKANTYEQYLRNVKNEDTGKWEQVESYRRVPVLPMGHGEKSVFLIQQYMALTEEEALAIYWHMGAYDISPYKTLNECSQAWNTYPLAFLLHISDMKATYLVENISEEE